MGVNKRMATVRKKWADHLYTDTFGSQPSEQNGQKMARETA